MKAPANAPVAAPAASTFLCRSRALLGALLLALTPGLASAGESEEWPTTPDRGRRDVKKVPWMRFSGDPTELVVVPGQTAHAREVLVVREQELTRRQRRLLRRADRRAEKAARLREKAGAHETRSAYALVVPVVHEAPPAPPPVVVEAPHPRVHVVHHEHEQESCDESEVEAAAHVPVVIDVQRISADVERAHRDAQRAHERAQRAHERAERARERAHRDAERSSAHAYRRGHEVQRAAHEAMRDGKIDEEEQRRIAEAARRAAHGH
jgi:hypothetical protein